MADFIVTTLNDELDSADTNASTFDSNDLSLREALALANGTAGADTITFAAGGTLTLTQGALTVADVTIDGDVNGDNVADVTINGNNASRVINMASGTSTLDALVITGGKSVFVGGVLVSGYAAATIVNTLVSGNEGTYGTGGIGIPVEARSRC
jgi:hypothetical protein